MVSVSISRELLTGGVSGERRGRGLGGGLMTSLFAENWCRVVADYLAMFTFKIKNCKEVLFDQQTTSMSEILRLKLVVSQ